MQSAVELLQAFPDSFISGGIGAVILFFWRQDRRDRAEVQKIELNRYEALAKDFRTIVEENTRAISTLAESVRQCPFRPGPLSFPAAKL